MHVGVPPEGIGDYKNPDLSRIDIAADWLEAAVLFGGEEVSKTDVVDALKEGSVFTDQDEARDYVDSAWVEVKRRARLMADSYPLTLSSQLIYRKVDWPRTPAFAFCLFLSCSSWYPTIRRQPGRHPQQGEIFERLAEHSLRATFSGWSVERVGYSPGRARGLEQVISEVAACLRESPQEGRERYFNADDKDKGLDLILHRPIADDRPGPPVYLIQCASGNNRNYKMHTPDPDTWEKFIDFSWSPEKAFAIPHALTKREYRSSLTLVKGPIFDRTRLLAADALGRDWLPHDLAREMTDWLRPLLPALMEL